MELQEAHRVFYNGGNGSENEYALVIGRHTDEHILDLCVLSESGNAIHKNVAQREPEDYGPEGGGATWHLHHHTF